jgi:predicted DNA-binding transcriptional regulator AlpA
LPAIGLEDGDKTQIKPGDGLYSLINVLMKMCDMDKKSNVPILIPMEADQLMELIRIVVKEELDKFSTRQISLNYKTPGLTYKPLYKMDEVCQMFEITPPTVYDWIKRGKLKPKKIRSRVFFLWNDIQELLLEK